MHPFLVTLGPGVVGVMALVVWTLTRSRFFLMTSAVCLGLSLLLLIILATSR